MNFPMELGVVIQDEGTDWSLQRTLCRHQTVELEENKHSKFKDLLHTLHRKLAAYCRWLCCVGGESICGTLRPRVDVILSL